MTNLSVSAIEIYYKWSNIMHVVTGAIKGTSLDHIYRELGSESLTGRRWCRIILFLQNNQWF